MKKMYFKTAGLLSIFFLFSVNIQAEIKLPAIFGDHMVLQQQTNAAIWGTATPDKTVRIVTSWDKKSYLVQADQQGNWKIKVKTPKAGGPYEIIISDGLTLKLKDVLIGEVWICSGQSNMEMPMKGYRNQPIAGSLETIVTSQNSLIRFISIKKDKNNFAGEWQECLPENVANFSATAYYFGKMIQQVLGVPVGLIDSSWGGTRIEPWISETGIKNFEWINFPDNEQKGNIPTLLFNAMIKPMVGYGIRGVIWYQGESNRDEPDKYQKLLPGLAENWRAEWSIGDFPFYYVQIAPYDGSNSALLREAQLKAADCIPNFSMACVMETGEKSCIHPANKKVAGDRLAYLALAKTYGKSGFAYSGPILKEMIVEGSIVKLTFNYADNGLTSYGKELENFEVAGEDKRFYRAKALITSQGISLCSPSVEKPVAVRYAFEDFVVGDLFNTEGLPASSFRTDNW